MPFTVVSVYYPVFQSFFCCLLFNQLTEKAWVDKQMYSKLMVQWNMYKEK